MVSPGITPRGYETLVPGAAYARPWRVAQNDLILGYEVILTNRVTHPSRERVFELLCAAARSSRRVDRRSPPYRAIVERAIDRGHPRLVEVAASSPNECERIFGPGLDPLYGDTTTRCVSLTCGELPALVVDDVREHKPVHRRVGMIRRALNELRELPNCGARWQVYLFLEDGVVQNPNRVRGMVREGVVDSFESLVDEIDHRTVAFEPVLRDRASVARMPSHSKEAIAGYIADCVVRLSKLVDQGRVRL